MAKIHTIGGVQYREVKRKAEVGEKIRVVNAAFTFGKYHEGDVFTVKSQSPRGNCVVVEETGVYIRHSDYVVLEPVAPDDIIVHEGKQYRKVDRPVRKGDVILALVDEEDLVRGAVYKVSRAHAGGGRGIRVIDDAKDDHYLRADEYVVLEPVVPSPSALEAELAATKAKVVELEAKLAEIEHKKAEEAKWAAIGRKPGEFKVGDIAEVVVSPAALPNGTLFEVKEVRGSYVYDHEGFVYILPWKQLKLVAPVESVVNLRGGDVA
ncbi:hypothetical protein [Brevibacillus agri]|uniref:hypothetical protein n=1 Tax=Brevibacillus agri TaxID=51101 RepID=UPI000470FDCF|nr:hypothetical protein [Brevibacillus agri]